VKLGASNGRETQILSGTIKPGERVATDIVTPSGKDNQP
jgi:multidrug efflux pump subunit AcrA (membrane-fusion protein)